MITSKTVYTVSDPPYTKEVKQTESKEEAQLWETRINRTFTFMEIVENFMMIDYHTSFFLVNKIQKTRADGKKESVVSFFWFLKYELPKILEAIKFCNEESIKTLASEKNMNPDYEGSTLSEITATIKMGKILCEYIQDFYPDFVKEPKLKPYIDYFLTQN